MSARLGHSRIAITADTYAHVTRRGDADAAARVGGAMRAAARDLSETATLRVSDEIVTPEHNGDPGTVADLRRMRVGGPQNSILTGGLHRGWMQRNCPGLPAASPGPPWTPIVPLGSMTYLQAAEQVLREDSPGSPMHYRKITELIGDRFRCAGRDARRGSTIRHGCRLGARSFCSCSIPRLCSCRRWRHS
jgi:hypothetical protein